MSSDPEGVPLTFVWRQLAGQPVALDDSGGERPSFTVDVAGESLVFELIVSDGELDSLPDTVSIEIEPPGLPVADAGADQRAAVGQQVALDGTASASLAGAPLQYNWSQTQGPAVTLSDPNDAAPVFTVPDDPSELVFSLTVTDPFGTSAPDTIAVSVETRPIADAGEGFVFDHGSTAMLDGTDSFDPEGQRLGYQWRQIEGPEVPLFDADTSRPSFDAPPERHTLVFELVVTNDSGIDSLPDTVEVDARRYTGELASVEVEDIRRDLLDVGGDTRSLLSHEGVLYVAAGEAGLKIYQHVDGERALIGEMETPGQALDIARVDGRLFVADGTAGLSIVDVSNPRAPTLIGGLVFEGELQADHISAEGGLAVVTRFNADTMIVDVSEPTQPTLRGIIADRSDDLLLRDGLLYSLGAISLGTYDLSDPDDPVELFSVRVSNQSRGLHIHEGVLYVLSNVVQLFDLSTPSRPSLLSEVLIAQTGLAVDVKDDIAHVVGAVSSYRRIDVSDPSAPIDLGPDITGDVNYDIAFFGDEVVTSNGPLGLNFIRTTPRLDDFLLHETTVPLGGHLITEGDRGFVVGMGLVALDLSDPGGPQVTDVVEERLHTQATLLHGDTLLNGASEGLAVFDVNGPLTEPRIAHESRLTSMTSRGDTLASFSLDGELLLFDVSSQDPVLRSRTSIEDARSSTSGLAWLDDVIYIALTRELIVVKVSDDAPPSVEDTVMGLGCSGLYHQRSIMVCTGGASRLKILNVARRASPQLITEIDLDEGSFRNAVMEGTSLFFLSNQSVVQMDLSHPTHPRLVGIHWLPRHSNVGLALHEGNVLTNSPLHNLSATLMAIDPSLRARLLEDHGDTSPGQTLGYTIEGWSEPQFTACSVTAGTCSVEGTDQDGVRVSWTLPDEPGDYELSVAIGDSRLFQIVGRDRVFVR